MCTVTYIPSREGFYLSANQDERIGRSTASAPKIYKKEDLALMYPSDEKKGGTWIAVKNDGTTVALLDGAFTRPSPAARLIRSRGLVLIDILRRPEPLVAFIEINLAPVEPFSIIIRTPDQLYECRWDGNRKHILQCEITKPRIWSSVALYEASVIDERLQKFGEWLPSSRNLTVSEVYSFHHQLSMETCLHDSHPGRKKDLKTLSITIVEKTKESARMAFTHQITGRKTMLKMSLSVVASRKNRHPGNETGFNRYHLAFRRLWLQIVDWKYWPSALIYGPISPYWLWLSIKARSPFFFNACNPGIENGGFIYERKSAVYSLLPLSLYPRTSLFKAGTDWIVVKYYIGQNGFHFPLVAKPDIGKLGAKARILSNATELESYCNTSQVDFLIQDFIGYPNEAGIFYARLPGEKRGTITGIAGKHFPTVTGDGVATIRQLLQRNSEYLFQLDNPAWRDAVEMDTILRAGQTYVLPAAGNHTKAVNFVDLSDRISERLITMIDTVCSQIAGFFYGRIDIKFESWDELLNGRNFSIIDLNGAGSEPHHIYDSSHSIYYAWKEIIRHWRLLHKISTANSIRDKIAYITMNQGIKLFLSHRRHLKLIKNP